MPAAVNQSRPYFDKILIANRGEIALRIGRTCRDLGIDVVAVYSEADRKALHARFSLDSVPLGPSPPSESYLRGDKIIQAALDTGAQAIHPGFGFLSENTAFAQAVTDAGLVFIGPPPKSMEIMGDKLSARQAMVAAGVPVVPGTTEPVADVEAATLVAGEVGYPVMLKAAAGGGGKGIRIVSSAKEIDSAFRTASGEAKNAFGDGRMYIEKFLPAPRHIEVQVLADHHGRVLHLGERECSVQRRHQKLVEEAPAASLPEETRAELCQAAVQAAKAVGYRSAGTVEFLYSEGKFYFLEMNTRLQVEHGVTEEIYGVDLVEQMIRIAAGQPLELPEQLFPRGHAIEVRLNAEDPDRNFAPSTGVLRNLRLPGGPGVRIDSAAYRGMEVTPYYDSMLGKLIAWGPNRKLALRRMIRVLQELHVGGIKTSAGVALRILESAEFQKGQYDTGFLEAMLAAEEDLGRPISPLEEVAAIAAALHRQHTAARAQLRPTTGNGTGPSPWVLQGRRNLVDHQPR
ncbi:MAG: acetyl-CoA carboxylase biotin carboxylase subunit [Planctomycetota bacterium]|nr:MAG: acetyl-CoA carboxylase biotin carboxylase subunit [Planctomycetota bacterium]